MWGAPGFVCRRAKSVVNREAMGNGQRARGDGREAWTGATHPPGVARRPALRQLQAPPRRPAPLCPAAAAPQDPLRRPSAVNTCQAWILAPLCAGGRLWTCQCHPRTPAQGSYFPAPQSRSQFEGRQSESPIFFNSSTIPASSGFICSSSSMHHQLPKFYVCAFPSQSRPPKALKG